jgi:hypothetical protein
MKFAGLLVTALVLGQSLPAFAQYHYSYGNSRVTNQNQTGLYHPSATYIGCGTMSQSAQGKSAGVGGALPSVNMGSHVRTPGDNMYNNDGTDRMYNGALVYRDQEEAMYRKAAQKQRAAIMRQRWLETASQQQQQQGYVYVPGSNGAASTYGSAPQTQMQYTRTGAATYGGTGGGTSYKPATRGF